jgi:hypothetical protein
MNGRMIVIIFHKLLTFHSVQFILVNRQSFRKLIKHLCFALCYSVDEVVNQTDDRSHSQLVLLETS